MIRPRGRDFPAGPVAETLSSKAEGTGSIPDQGAEIPHASCQNQNKNRSNIVMNKDVKKRSILKKKKKLKKFKGKDIPSNSLPKGKKVLVFWLHDYLQKKF